MDRPSQVPLLADINGIGVPPRTSSTQRSNFRLPYRTYRNHLTPAENFENINLDNDPEQQRQETFNGISSTWLLHRGGKYILSAGWWEEEY